MTKDEAQKAFTAGHIAHMRNLFHDPFNEFEAWWMENRPQPNPLIHTEPGRRPHLFIGDVCSHCGQNYSTADIACRGFHQSPNAAQGLEQGWPEPTD